MVKTKWRDRLREALNELGSWLIGAIWIGGVAAVVVLRHHPWAEFLIFIALYLGFAWAGGWRPKD